MLARKDYEKNVQENINTVVADGKLNEAVSGRALDQK